MFLPYITIMLVHRIQSAKGLYTIQRLPSLHLILMLVSSTRLFEYGTNEIPKKIFASTSSSKHWLGLEELPIHLQFIVQIMLLDIKKAEKAIFAFESVGRGEFSFHSSLDDILDDEAEVQLHPNVKQWLHNICQMFLTHRMTALVMQNVVLRIGMTK